MNKNSKFWTLGLMVLSAVGFLAGCSEAGSDDGSGDAELTEVQKVVAEAEKLDRDALYKKAAEELGTTNTFHFLATSSRGGKVKGKFVEALQAYNSDITESQIDYQTTVDGKIYTTLNAEIEAGITDGYSAALLQDGYQLQTKGIEKGYVNYIPREWSEGTGINVERDSNPFSLQFNFKTLMFNNANNDVTIDNIWDITASKYKGKLDTMDPTNENVNMDWLIQLTSDENCDLLIEAFNDSTNDAKSEITVDDYSKYGDKRKYAMAFMAKFIENAVFYADDGAAVNQLAKAPGDLGWIVYSKIQNISETADISKKNIVIAALGNENTDGTTATMQIKGFGGFMYKHYLMLMPESPLPWTSCAFINFLSTTADGYAKWASDVGDYPTLPSINIDRTKNGHGTLDTSGDSYTWTQDSTKDNVFPCLNDPDSDWWINKANSIVETPSYIAQYYNVVMSFIQTCIANKS